MNVDEHAVNIRENSAESPLQESQSRDCRVKQTPILRLNFHATRGLDHDSRFVKAYKTLIFVWLCALVSSKKEIISIEMSLPK